jgi:tetratricopeptide (TPR) repeat protein
MCMLNANRRHSLALIAMLATACNILPAQSGQHPNAESPSISAIKPLPTRPELTSTTHQLDAMIDAHHFKVVRMITEARIKANPKDADALYFLSRVKFAFQQRDEAIELAEKAIALNPNNAEYRCQLAKSVGDKARNASFFEKPKLARIMKREGEMALQIDPDQQDAHYGMMLFHLEAPGFVGGNKKKAHELVVDLIRLNPVYGNVAFAEYKAHEKASPQEIEEFYVKAVGADPTSYRAQFELARFYLSSTVWKNDAIALAEKSAKAEVQIDPNRVQGYNQLAQILALQHHWKDLDELLVQSEKNVKDDLAPYYFAANAILNTYQDPNRAEKYLKKYLATEPEGEEPDLGEAHWKLGLALERLGQNKEAKSELQVAEKMRPDLEDIHKDLKRMR